MCLVHDILRRHFFFVFLLSNLNAMPLDVQWKAEAWVLCLSVVSKFVSQYVYKLWLLFVNLSIIIIFNACWKKKHSAQWLSEYPVAYTNNKKRTYTSMYRILFYATLPFAMLFQLFSSCSEYIFLSCLQLFSIPSCYRHWFFSLFVPKGVFGTLGTSYHILFSRILLLCGFDCTAPNMERFWAHRVDCVSVCGVFLERFFFFLASNEHNLCVTNVSSISFLDGVSSSSSFARMWI